VGLIYLETLWGYNNLKYFLQMPFQLNNLYFRKGKVKDLFISFTKLFGKK